MKTEFVRYLERLSELYPTIDKASTEIINLQSILNLPKGTEHFLSDIHGEYESFSHVLRNGSGAVRKKIDDVFGHTLGTNDKSELASLIYYPKEKIDYIKSLDKDTENWYKITLYRLIEICKVVSSKYTRSKVRKALPPAYAYVIEELITEKPEVLNRGAYYDGIVNTILEIGAAEKFIIAIAELIQRLVVDHLHIIGDIYDRGSGAHKIMDKLCSYHSLDIQWGNHDILWMGAAVGNPACIATVIRNSIRYGNLDVIEDGYGINMIPLATFAMSVYADDDCSCFEIKNKKHSYETEIELEMKMHKAITVIQFKLEGQLIQNHPEFDMNERCLLDKIDFENGTVTIGENVYKMKDVNFPTIDKENPYKLTEREEDMMNKLYSAFVKCEKLQKHMQLMLKKGGMYKVYNGNLLFHGCVPMNSDGTFTEVTLFGETVSGKSLMDKAEQLARDGYFAKNGSEEKEYGKDFLWFLWCGCYSPVYGKNKMTSFERYFIDDESTWVEIKDEYYHLIEKPSVCNKILCEFGIDPNNFSHIINGHVPVKIKKGESPIKSNGKLLVIDGGLSKAYQKVTGLAGYTLLFNSHGLLLSAHDAFESIESAIKEEKDIHSTLDVVELAPNRLLVEDTDAGKSLSKKITDLKALVDAYLKGKIKTH